LFFNIYRNSNANIANNACKAFANLTNGTPEQISALLDRGLLTKLSHICSNQTWTKNITKSLKSHIAQILEHVTLAADELMLEKVINSRIFETSAGIPDLADEHSYYWALSNATFAANERQLEYLIRTNFHVQLAKGLIASDECNVTDKDLKIALCEGLKNIVSRAPKVKKDIPQVVLLLRKEISNSGDGDVQSLAMRLVQLLTES